MPEKLDLASNFANKLWNAAKFVTINAVSDEEVIEFYNKNFVNNKFKEGSLKYVDKWIISKLNKLIKEVSNNIENYDLGVALEKIYSFIRDEFCDWYIEMVKPQMHANADEDKVRISFMLDYILRNSMKLLHPFMPFVTTQIYNSLVKYNDKELMISKWPEYNENLNFENEENAVEELKEIIVGIRNLRTSQNIHPSKKAPLIFVMNNMQDLILSSKEMIEKLGFASDIKIESKKENIKDSTSIRTKNMEVIIPLGALIDKNAEKERIMSEIRKLEMEVERSTKILSNAGFLAKAPKEKVEEEKAKLEKYQELLKAAKERLKNFDK